MISFHAHFSVVNFKELFKMTFPNPINTKSCHLSPLTITDCPQVFQKVWKYLQILELDLNVILFPYLP